MDDFENIISIHGAPRSGTSWLGQIFDSSSETRFKFQPLFSYAFKDRISLNSTKDEIIDYYHSLYGYKDDFLDQIDTKKKGTYPIFEDKSESPGFLVTKMVRYHYLIPHLLANVPKVKFIAIVRNPCGVMNSWRKAPKEFLPEWIFKDEWVFAQSKNKFRPEEYFGYHKWKESTKLFIEMEKSHKDSFYLIRYEDLVTDPVKTVQRLFQFSGLKLEQQTVQFMSESTSLNQEDVYSVYKGCKDIKDWESELDAEVRQSIHNDLRGTEFENFLL